MFHKGKSVKFCKTAKKVKKKTTTHNQQTKQLYSLKLELRVHKTGTFMPRCHGIFCVNLFIAEAPCGRFNENYLSSGKKGKSEVNAGIKHWKRA